MATVAKLKVSVIVLNYNGFKNTKDCLLSLENCKTKNADVKIIVVDNDSNDGSVRKLEKGIGYTFLKNSENLGYTGGNNVGIKHALSQKSDYILILNNDTVVDKSFLSELVKARPKAEILSPKIFFSPGYEFHKNRYKKQDLGRVIWYAGGKIDWDNILGIHLGVDQVDSGQFEKSREIEYATGAALFVKKEVFEKIGLFDGKYFLYLEDMDFSVRAKKAGFKIFFEPKAIIWHKNAGSAGGSGSELQDYYITRNRLLFAFKFANLKTKIAVLRQAMSQVKDPTKRRALVDFLTGNFGKGSFQV